MNWVSIFYFKHFIIRPPQPPPMFCLHFPTLSFHPHPFPKCLILSSFPRFLLFSLPPRPQLQTRDTALYLNIHRAFIFLFFFFLFFWPPLSLHSGSEGRITPRPHPLKSRVHQGLAIDSLVKPHEQRFAELRLKPFMTEQSEPKWAAALWNYCHITCGPSSCRAWPKTALGWISFKISPLRFQRVSV